MDEFTYPAFLQGKIQNQHAMTHLLQEENAILKDKVTKLLKDISGLRKNESELRGRNRQAEERIGDLQMELKRAKEVRNIKAKNATESRQRRMREQSQQGYVDPKQIFKSYIDNTFPRNKGTIKKLLKAFFVLEQREGMQPIQKIKFYQGIFEGFLKRVLDWIFPRKTQAQKSQTIAQNLMKQWKEREHVDRKELDKTNLVLLKQAEYINRIQKLQSEILMLRSSKGMLESRLKTYERGLQIKGGEFIVHLKKMLQEEREIEPESYQKVEEIIALFTNAAKPVEKKQEKEEEGPLMTQQVPLLLSSDKTPGHRRKAAPVLKKNIYGYYQQPQFEGNYTLSLPTRHADPHKHTQTLPQDLCVLTLHPVIFLTLIDGNIKPQRNRHSLQHYVRIRVNQQSNTDSEMREGNEPVWNEPFLLKDYDFPFIQVSLMHKSKGLRDYALGGGKLSVSSAQEKIVNIRKEKGFHGRVRFSLTYPKGNIYEFKITSVKLQIPSGKIILKEQVIIKFPYNPQINLQFILPEQVVYLERSAIILETSDQSMSAKLTKNELKGQVPLKEIVGQQGNKEVVVQMDDWKVIIQGEFYLLICEEEQPEVIAEELLEGGKGKYFSVRAPPPIVTVTYSDIVLHSSIKFPLVFALNEEVNRLSIIKELPNREITLQMVEPIINKQGCLCLSEFIKAPGKIYKFFIETIEGEQVRLRHQSHLFQRLLKEVQLQVSYREDEVQEVDYARKNRSKKEKLYKQFAIESKELMLNHYKVFSRHFKRIGFVKFKLGYTIYDNQLLYENLNESVTIKQSRRLQPVRQGTYFIELELSEAHLPFKSKGSSYRCVINGESSSEKKGNHPQWGQTFIIQFQYLEVFELAVAYEVWEEGTFGKTKLYQGELVINDKIMILGAATVSLDADSQDCLHFSRISVPSSMIRLSIGEIEAQIKEQSDWIGKIDPYITISSKNRQLVKTKYLDNKGAHPVWTNINKLIIISKVAPSQPIEQDEQSLVECKVYDYDLIGKDDYLGEVKITAKLNPELMNGNQCEIMYGNLVKQNMICGSVRLKGSFEQFTQQAINFGRPNLQKLTRSDIVYRVVLYKVKINNLKEFQGDRGIFCVKTNGNILRQDQFSFNDDSLKGFSFNQWLVNSQKLQIQFKRQYKSFFKTFTESLGSISITTSGKQLIMGKSDITNSKGQQMGNCYWYVQAQDKIKYISFGNLTSCHKKIIVKSDLQHQLSLNNLSQDNYQSILFYQQKIIFCSKQSQKQTELTLKDAGRNVYGLFLNESEHTSMIAYFNAEMSNVLQIKMQERTDRTKADQSRQYKQLSSIHWEPYQYQTSTSYLFILKLSGTQETVTLKEDLNLIYNDYLVLKPFDIPVIFNSNEIPKSVEVINAKTSQIEALLNVQQSAKVLIPNKGVFYYKLQNYNLKSIMEFHFSYVLIRFRDQEKFKNSKNVKIVLTSSLSLNMFSSQLIPHTNSFLFEDIKMLVAEAPQSATTFFFDAEITGQDKKQLSKFKFGFRLQFNKQQYRIIDNPDYMVQGLFQCVLIDRNYNPPAIEDNTIHGMSFIDLQELQFEANEDPSNRHIFAEISLSNQYQKIYLQRVQGTNYCKCEISSIFFIQKSSKAQVTIIQEGVLSNSVLGTSSITFSETFIKKEIVSFHQEVKKDMKIMGRLNIRYCNLKEIPFIDINMFTYISRTNAAMVAELQQFGPNKQKYQRLTLTSRGEDVARLQSQDSFIVTKDPREYEITVNERDTNKLLGQFKLYHQLKDVGDRITVLQPLRTSTNSLNGVMIIEYVSKRSDSRTWNQTVNEYILLTKISVSNLTLKKHNAHIGLNFAVRLRSSLRENKTKMMPFGKANSQTCATFTIYNNESCEIQIVNKSDLIGSAKIAPPYLQNEERIVVLAKDEKTVGIFTLRISYVKQQSVYNKMRQITSIQASRLIDTQTFSKMTPYIQLDLVEKGPSFATELGLGKQKIFWKINLITSNAIKLTVKDKDMFFDDLIGTATLLFEDKEQQDDKMYQLHLFNQEQGKKECNGILKVFTSPIQSKLNKDSIHSTQVKEISYFMLQLGGIVNNNEALKIADWIEISLTSIHGRISLLKETYDDLLFYLSNKDIQVEFDNYFTGIAKGQLQVNVSLYQNSKIIFEQVISSKPKQNKDVFSIYKIIPLQKEFYFFEKIYIWMLEKIPENLCIYLCSQSHYQKLHIVTYQKYLMVVQPNQLCPSINPAHPLSIIVREGNQILLQFNLTLDKDSKQSRYISNGPILNSKSEQMGYFYAGISKFLSKGEQMQRRINIGKSRRKWLNLCICEAILTKDVQIFSNMDPYCHFGPAGTKQAWRKTSVQDNIGMHPIWNQSFFIEVIEGQSDELVFAVMDQEVTSDRAIGQGKTAVKPLLENNDRQIQLLYKGQEPSGKLRVQISSTTSYVIFRNMASVDQGQEFYIFNQNNKEGEEGVQIKLGVAYALDPKKEIKLKFKQTVKKWSYTELKEQQLVGVSFAEECAWLHYDIYE